MVKSIETIKPDFILLFATEKAVLDGWTRCIESYLERHESDFASYQIIKLKPSMLQAVNFFNKTMSVLRHLETLDNIKDLIIDQTSGPGMLRSIVAFAFQNWAKKQNIPFSVSYVDPDKQAFRQVKFLSSSELEEIEIPIKLIFKTEPILEHLLLYLPDQEGHDFKQLNFRDAPDDLALEKLKIFKKNLTLRFLFCSWLQCSIQYEIVNNPPELYQTDSIKQLLENFEQDLLQLLGESGIAVNYKNQIIELLKEHFANPAIFKDFFRYLCKNLFSNKSPSFENSFNRLKEEFLYNNSRALEAKETIKIWNQIYLKAQSFRIYAEKDLAETYRNPGSEFSAKKDQFLDSFLSRRGLNKFRRLFVGQKIGFSFESVLEEEVRRIISGNKRLKEEIVSCYTGVKCKKNNQVLLELDILIMFKTGQLLIFEAKTSSKSATRKDMESRVKNLKDLLGAKANLVVVYPFIKKDLDAIQDLNEEYFCSAWEFGLPEFSGWYNYLRDSMHEFQRRIIGFDELEKELLRQLPFGSSANT